MAHRAAPSSAATVNPVIVSDQVQALGQAKEVLQASGGGADEEVTGSYAVAMRFARPDYGQNESVPQAGDDIYLFARAGGDCARRVQLRLNWSADGTTLHPGKPGPKPKKASR